MLCNLQILIILIRRVKKHPISADESFRDSRTKKSSTLAGGKHKNRCLCNIPFKSDDKGEPRKNTSFGFFFNFLPLIILSQLSTFDHKCFTWPPDHQSRVIFDGHLKLTFWTVLAVQYCRLIRITSLETPLIQDYESWPSIPFDYQCSLWCPLSQNVFGFHGHLKLSYWLVPAVCALAGGKYKNRCLCNIPFKKWW